MKAVLFVPLLFLAGCSTPQRHQPLNVSVVTAPVHQARTEIRRAEQANTAAEISVTKAQEQVKALETLVSSDLKPRVQLLGAALGEVQSQLANEKLAHQEADKQLADSEVKGMVLQQQANAEAKTLNEALDTVEKDKATIKLYNRDLWVLGILAGIALVFAVHKFFIPKIAEGFSGYAMAGAFVLGVALVWAAHGMGIL